MLLMRRFAILLLFFSISLSAQNIRISEVKGTGGLGEGYEISFYIRDSATKTPLPGALVTIAINKDTLRAVTGSAGHAKFKNTFASADSASISISFLGYKTNKAKYKFSLNSYYCEAFLVEDPQELSSIIITEKAVTMIVRGDTTVYTTGALNAMEGEYLKDILRRLPGIAFRDGSIYANGKIVSKVLIDGRTLFGKDISSAINIVEGNNIKSIEVFDEHDRDRMIEADTLKIKERVLNVVTKNGMKNVRQLELAADAGGSVSRKQDPYLPKFLSAGYLGFHRFEEKKPSFRLGFRGGNNDNEKIMSRGTPLSGGAISTDKTLSKANAHIAGDYTVARRFSIGSSLNFGFAGDKKLSGSLYDYGETHGLTSSLKSSSKSDIKGSYKAKFNKAVREVWNMGLDLEFGYSGYKSEESDRSERSIGAKTLIADSYTKGLNDGIYLKLRSSNSFLFKKTGRALNVSLSYKFSEREGHGGLYDNKGGSSFPRSYTDTSSRYGHDVHFDVSYGEPLIKNLSLKTKLVSNFQSQLYRKSYWNALLGKLDAFNSEDYSQNNIRNVGSAGLEYYNGQISASVDFIAERLDMQRNDRLLSYKTEPKPAYSFYPNIKISGYFPRSTISLDFQSYTDFADAALYNGVLNTLNPLYLSVGNPELGLMKGYVGVFASSYNIPKANMNLSLFGSLNIQSRGLANKITQFISDTYLPEYDYTAPAGSQLSMPVSIKGQKFYLLRTGLDKSVFRIKSNFNLSLEYFLNETPFLLQVEGPLGSKEVSHINRNTNWRAAMRVNFFPSSKVNMDLEADGLRSSQFVDKELSFTSWQFSASLKSKILLLKRIRIEPAFVWTKLDSQRDEADFSRYMLDCSITYRFGKDYRGEAGIYCNNILDDLNVRSASLVDQAVLSQIDRSMLGRRAGLFFIYKFK